MAFRISIAPGAKLNPEALQTLRASLQGDFADGKVVARSAARPGDKPPPSSTTQIAAHIDAENAQHFMDGLRGGRLS